MQRFFPWFEQVYEWIHPYMSRFTIAILILLMGFIVGKLISRFILRLLNELRLDAALKKTVGLKFSISKVLSAYSAFIIYFVTIILFLNSLGLTTVIINAIAIGVIIVVVISLILGVRDFIPNLAAGLTLYKKEKIKVGDEIEMQGIKGKVVEVSLLDTQIRTSSRDHVFIPNATLIKNVFKKRR